MANETTVKISADASGYTAELDRAAKSAQAFMATQDAAAQRVKVAQQAIAEAATTGSKASAKAISNFVSQLARTADQAGKTRAELLAMKAAQMGISDSVSGYISTVEKAAESTHGFSLATGAARRELAVLAHEAATGNWSRFAGSLGVLGERTGVINMLFSATGATLLVAAAAAVAFVYEIEQGAKQVEAFNKAINSTGGYVGLSVEQMIALSNRLQSSTASLTTVREAMAQVAATGAFTADNLGLATQAALAMSEGIGISTDKAAESLAKTQENVIKWVTEYQRAHHTFDAAQIEEIERFVKLGDTVSATAAAMRDIVTAQDEVSASAQENMGAVAKLWDALKFGVNYYKNAINSIGIPDGVTQQLTDQLTVVQAAQRNLAQQKSMGSMGNLTMAQQQLDIETKKLNVLRDQQAVDFKRTKSREGAGKSGDAKLAVDSYLNSSKYASPSQQHTLELSAESESFSKATKDFAKNSADYQAALKRHYDNVQQINTQYAKKTRAPSNDGAIQAELARIAGNNALIEQQAKNSERVLKAQRDIGVISAAQYFQSLHDIEQKALDEEIANAQKRADVAAGKKEQSSYQEALTGLQKLKDARLQIGIDLKGSLDTLEKEHVGSMEKYANQQAEILKRQTDGYAAAYDTRNMTATMKADYEARRKLVESNTASTAELQEQYDGPAADKAELAEKLARLADFYSKQQTSLETNLKQQQAIRNSYSEQMHTALVGLGGDAQSNAQIMGSAFTKSMEDMESALDKFVTTGKFSFSSFAASVMADMAKIALHAAEMRIFQSVASSAMFSTGGPVGHFADGGAISGAGTGTSDSIPAMLSNGEFVINAASTQKYRGLLESINGGHMAHFASGGAVGSVSPSGSATGSSNQTNLHMHLQGGGGLNESDVAALLPMFQMLIDKRMAQKMNGQGGYADLIKQGRL